MSQLHLAIETFARGFAFTRSFTHECRAERVGPLWVVRDAPRKQGSYRVEEWISSGIPPAETDRIARENTRGRYAICAIHASDEPDTPLRSDYKSLGYRLRTTEPLMVHDLDQVPQVQSPAHIVRVMTGELASQLAKIAGARQILPEHLSPQAPLRQYVALIDGALVGYVRSIRVGNATWCSNMFVLPAFRRRGIARAMLCRMLRDDKAEGAVAAVLTATHTGVKLYPLVGYRHVGTLLLFSPVRRQAAGHRPITAPES